MTLLRKPILAALLALACGGGGSGSSPSVSPSVPSPSFSVSVDRAELRFDGDEANASRRKRYWAVAPPPLPGAIYTGALDLGTSVDHITAEVIGRCARLHRSAAA